MPYFTCTPMLMYELCTLAEANRERERERERDRRRRRRTQLREGGADARGWGAVSCGSCAGGSCAARSAFFGGVFLHIASFHINSYTKRIFFVSRLRGIAKTITFARKKSNPPIALNSFETNQICDLALAATVLSQSAKLVIPALAILQKPILAM